MTRKRQYVRDSGKGLGERWFTAPVNTPQGLFFTGCSREQANRIWAIARLPKPLVSDAAMIAAPGVTRFVGAGGYGSGQSGI